MAIDYLGVAARGQWLQFDTTFSKCARTSCYAEVDISADRQTMARARAAFRIEG